MVKKKTMEVRTLEDFLLASPTRKPNFIFEGQLYVFTHFSSSSSSSLLQSTTHESKCSSETTTHDYSLERLVMLDREADQDQSMSFSSNGRCRSSSQSEKSKKRVRFRLPEEADIYIFYSPTIGKS
ncbi:hypothetical protein M5689_001570 [Euphorbia peplus]|nr:hypothetical protein M5689_001570 [Euphorbia peplus]